MDNIQKLILGVLGIAGMLTMLVPSGGVTVPAPTAATDVPVVTAPVLEATAEGQTIGEDGEIITEETESSDDDVFAIGEPAIDGNPLQGPSNNSNGAAQQAPQFAPTQNYEYTTPGLVTDQASPQPFDSAPGM